jgi:hypothetical protein
MRTVEVSIFMIFHGKRIYTSELIIFPRSGYYIYRTRKGFRGGRLYTSPEGMAIFIQTSRGVLYFPATDTELVKVSQKLLEVKYSDGVLFKTEIVGTLKVGCIPQNIGGREYVREV